MMFIASSLVLAAILNLPTYVYSATVSATVAQTFLGVGGSGAWWPHDLFNFPESVRQNLSELLFSESGLAISSYRYNLGGGGVGVSNPVRAPETPYVSPGVYNFSADPEGTFFLQQASDFGVPGITMFVNSAPAPLTSNGFSCNGQFVNANGPAYATYLVDVAQHWREAGINISFVSAMNEPDNSFGPLPCGQEGMLVEANQRATLITSLWNELESRGLTSEIGILADESSSTSLATSEYSEWLPEVVDMVAHIVHHAYDFPTDAEYEAFINSANAVSGGKTTWMSEICCSLGSPDGSGKGYSGGFDPTIDNALIFVIGGEAHYDFWTLVSLGSDANEFTLVVSNSTTYSVIAMNPNTTESTISLTFPQDVCASTAFRTSATEDFSTVTPATGSGLTWSLPLSETSLTTYIFKREAC
ncbi:glycoside hydrolase [Gymnopus androsaceus JB14]|uniref:Glycoside hydrolase n=1 Tax=Gymnopus androsaceus JB14 TaxID=1447944 RepID=A0A6A4HYF7_9AGAR|nr:glycoside hydrolase [Gymnopus androsaceus JB14]